VGDNQILICPGAQRSGTTFLYSLLSQHPDINFSKYKEVHFFSVDHEYKKGINYFLDMFKEKENKKYIADCTPEYLPKFYSISRIKKEFGDNVKFIVVLRDPIKRAFSQYNMRISKGRKTESFYELIEKQSKEEIKYTTLIGRGLYYDQLNNLYKYYSNENIFIITFEQLTNNTDKTMKQVLEFLDINTNIIFDKNVNINEKPNAKGNLLGVILYAIPIHVRRKLVDVNSKTIQYIKKNVLLKKHTKINKAELNEQSIKLLKKYYANSNKLLHEKYGVDTSKWL